MSRDSGCISQADRELVSCQSVLSAVDRACRYFAGVSADLATEEVEPGPSIEKRLPTQKRSLRPDYLAAFHRFEDVELASLLVVCGYQREGDYQSL